MGLWRSVAVAEVLGVVGFVGLVLTSSVVVANEDDGVVASVLSSSSSSSSWLNFTTLLQALFVAVVVGIVVVKLRAPKLKLPPGPLALPIVGNWLQVRRERGMILVPNSPTPSPSSLLFSSSFKKNSIGFLACLFASLSFSSFFASFCSFLPLLFGG
jgi:hypothetical protein